MVRAQSFCRTQPAGTSSTTQMSSSHVFLPVPDPFLSVHDLAPSFCCLESTRVGVGSPWRTATVAIEPRGRQRKASERIDVQIEVDVKSVRPTCVSVLDLNILFEMDPLCFLILTLCHPPCGRAVKRCETTICHPPLMQPCHLLSCVSVCGGL